MTLHHGWAGYDRETDTRRYYLVLKCDWCSVSLPIYAQVTEDRYEEVIGQLRYTSREDGWTEWIDTLDTAWDKCPECSQSTHI